MKTYHRKWIGFGYMIIFMLICIIGDRWYLNKMRLNNLNPATNKLTISEKR